MFKNVENKQTKTQRQRQGHHCILILSPGAVVLQSDLVRLKETIITYTCSLRFTFHFCIPLPMVSKNYFHKPFNYLVMLNSIAIYSRCDSANCRHRLRYLKRAYLLG